MIQYWVMAVIFVAGLIAIRGTCSRKPYNAIQAVICIALGVLWPLTCIVALYGITLWWINLPGNEIPPPKRTKR